MTTLAHAEYLDSEPGVLYELPHAGSPLEHPLVYDAVARDLQAMADHGLIEIVDVHTADAAPASLIDHLRYRRLR